MRSRSLALLGVVFWLFCTVTAQDGFTNAIAEKRNPVTAQSSHTSTRSQVRYTA